MRKDIRGWNALVTGASRGLGVEIARALARGGVNVALAARTASLLEEVRSSVEVHGVRATVVPCDVADPSSRLRLLETVEREFGSIDVLVNNAGIEATHPYHEYPPEEITRLLEVNLMAPLLLTRAVLPRMLAAGRGHIVNVSSLAGKAGFPFQAPYAASKAALVAFTHTLRAELEGTGVGCSVVCPGFVAEAGMYADMQRATGVKASRLLGESTPRKVADAVIKAIRNDASELIVNPSPMRPLLALMQLAPDAFPKVMRAFGVTSLARRIVAVQREGRGPAQPEIVEIAGSPKPAQEEREEPQGDRP